MTTPATRLKPNVLVTGTPGTGKTSLCELLARECGLTRISVGELAKEKQLYDGYDEEHQCNVLDEDAVLDELEGLLAHGNCVVDYHAAELFPERWFDLVVVLQTNNTVLFDRLVARGYPMSKVQENVECEIMQMILSEAMESYDPSIVKVMQSDTIEQMTENVKTVRTWCEEYAKRKSAGASSS